MTGFKIIELRKKLGLTQQGFATEIGVDKMTISRWERENKKIAPKYEPQIEKLDTKFRKAEADFVSLMEKIGPSPTSDLLTYVNDNPAEIFRYLAKQGLRIKINKQ